MKTKLLSQAGRLRLVVSLTVLFILVTSAIYAQQPVPGMGHGNRTPEDRAKQQTERMKEDLKLTPAQEPKVTAINLKYFKKLEDLRKITDTAAMRKSFNELAKQKEAELKPVLTADQLKSYQKMMEEQMARRRQMGR